MLVSPQSYMLGRMGGPSSLNKFSIRFFTLFCAIFRWFRSIFPGDRESCWEKFVASVFLKEHWFYRIIQSSDSKSNLRPPKGGSRIISSHTHVCNYICRNIKFDLYWRYIIIVMSLEKTFRHLFGISSSIIVAGILFFVIYQICLESIRQQKIILGRSS